MKSLHCPSLLHLATHGFFLSDSAGALPSADDAGGGEAEQPAAAGTASSEKVPPLLHSPMHRSGLALAGAQRVFDGQELPADQDDGVLTAEEVAALDLQGTRLVVLSASDTGLGEVRRGEGVMGLRRAFAASGATAVVMSLWSVLDEPTRQLMVDFHQRYRRTGDAALAMTEAQRQFLDRQQADGTLNPTEWGAFIVYQAATQ